MGCFWGWEAFHEITTRLYFGEKYFKIPSSNMTERNSQSQLFSRIIHLISYVFKACYFRALITLLVDHLSRTYMFISFVISFSKPDHCTNLLPQWLWKYLNCLGAHGQNSYRGFSSTSASHTICPPLVPIWKNCIRINLNLIGNTYYFIPYSMDVFALVLLHRSSWLSS